MSLTIGHISGLNFFVMQLLFIRFEIYNPELN